MHSFKNNSSVMDSYLQINVCNLLRIKVLEHNTVALSIEVINKNLQTDINTIRRFFFLTNKKYKIFLLNPY